MKAKLHLFDEAKIESTKKESLFRDAIVTGRKLATEKGDLEV